MPIDVLFFVTRLGTGGAEKHLLRVLNHLDRDQLRPLLAVARSGGSYEQFLHQDVELVCANRRQLPSSTLSIVSSVSGLRRLIAQRQPAVVVGILDPAIAALYSACRLIPAPRRPPLVACIQNNFRAESSDQRLSGKLLQPVINRAYRSASTVIALSHGVATALQAEIPSLSRVVIIPNAGLDSEEDVLAGDSIIEENEDNQISDRFRLVSCGRFVKQKGYPYLLQAIKLLRSQYPVELWMLGEGPKHAEVKAQVNELGLSDHVKFLGFQPNPRAYFRRCDAFVLSSLWEGFGNVIVEAMSEGLPVISTDCPYGPSEIITDGRNGFLVPPANAEALAEKIAWVISHPQQAQQVAQQARVRAADFESKVIAAQYAQTILDIATTENR